MCSLWLMLEGGSWVWLGVLVWPCSMRIFSFLEFVLFDLELGGMLDYEMTVFEIAVGT
jgi:hypothetical protein